MSKAHRAHPIRNTFVAGIFFLVPMGITVWVLDILVANTHRLAGPYVRRVLVLILDPVPLVVVKACSLILVLAVIFLIGWLANFYVGKKLLSLIDGTMLRLPFVRNIYGGSKQIIEAFSVQKTGGSFKKVVLVEYPRRDCWVLGFVTNEKIDQSRKLFGKDLVGVFIPSTPNPTTGFLIYYDPHELVLVDLEVEEAVKQIVSAGLVVPPILNKKKPISLAESLGLERAHSEST